MGGTPELVMFLDNVMPEDKLKTLTAGYRAVHEVSVPLRVLVVEWKGRREVVAQSLELL